MSKIYFICGFIGSGKTTYSKQLSESAPAFRFSIDEWMIPLYGEHMERDVFNSRIATLTELFKDSAVQMLNLGISVIFDFGFWTQSDRANFKEWADSLDIDSEFIYLDCSFDVCSERAQSRNKNRGEAAFEMTPEMLSMFWSWFEIPSADEVVTFV